MLFRSGASVPISSIRQAIRRVLNAELEPYRTLYLLDCPKSTKHVRPFESRQFDRQSTALFLKHVWDGFNEDMILFTKRDISSKDTHQPIIVGLKEPNAYRAQQHILARAIDLGYESRIVLPPARLQRQTETAPPQKISIDKNDVRWFK